ncbi:MAG TPA: adenylyl-sulfate kinase [Acidimicrobiales bacterium]|nr:adenylyl-sulfate kinase [Acidimicrobiales bacterium]
MRDLSEGVTIWLTGLPSSGKTTLAYALEKKFIEAGQRVEVLDGDVIREGLTADLGLSAEDRRTNVRRIGFVAELLSRHGVVAICPVIAPYRDARDEVRAKHEGRFIEVHVATPVELCSERDVKGLYAKQREGKLSGLTGVDDPYEAPIDPEIRIDTSGKPLEESVEELWQALHR